MYYIILGLLAFHIQQVTVLRSKVYHTYVVNKVRGKKSFCVLQYRDVVCLQLYGCTDRCIILAYHIGLEK